MIWQQEVLDKIVSKIKPFSDSAKKYKANEEEKLFIENLAREMLNVAGQFSSFTGRKTSV